MIFRRIKAHVEKENWFAVGIDFFIVVIGVFIGLQVANWNEARVEREHEQDYLLRLHEEVAAIIVEQESDRGEIVGRAKSLNEVAAYFGAYGEQEASEPEPIGPHCTAVIGSHVYAGDITLPPTISELISTGRILLVSNQSLRMQIVRFAQAMDEYGQLRHDIQVDRIVLSRKYPELINLSPAGRQHSSCDFSRMAQSQAFVNDFLDNAARYDAYAEDVIQGQHELRVKLKAALDQELAISYKDAT